jgi:hypothetical protein
MLVHFKSFILSEVDATVFCQFSGRGRGEKVQRGGGGRVTINLLLLVGFGRAARLCAAPTCLFRLLPSFHVTVSLNISGHIHYPSELMLHFMTCCLTNRLIPKKPIKKSVVFQIENRFLPEGVSSLCE